MKVHRLISVLLLMESRRTMKAGELASKLEISMRTVYRDIETLCEAGIPLTTTTGPNGGIHLMEGYSSGISYLQEDDIISLYLSGMGIQPDSQSNIAVKLNNTLLKLQKSLSQTQINDINNMKKKFYFDATPWWGHSKRLYNVDTLIHSIFQSKALRIAYQKYNGELSYRKIYPYGVVVKRMDWYLIAYCEKNKDIRTFKCERIIEYIILDENFNVPADFYIEDYWKESQRTFKNLCVEKENYPVSIRLNKNRVEVLSDMEVFEIKEDGDYILATINMYKYECAVTDIMKIIGYAEIINPTELRTVAEEGLEKIIMKYKNSFV